MDWESRVRERVAASGATVSVYWEDFTTGNTFSIDGDRVYHAASTMKIAVMVELFHQAHLGARSLDEAPTLENRFASAYDGAPYSLEIEDDSDPELYSLLGTPVSLRELVRRAIVRSSNLATNALLELLTPAAVGQRMSSLGVPHMRVVRGVEDKTAYANGIFNTVTADSLGRLLGMLGRGEVVSPEACREMRDILLAQELNAGIPALLPQGTRVAHKTGWIDRIFHDSGIVWAEGNPGYVLVVLTEGISEKANAERLVAKISLDIFDCMKASRESNR